MSKVLTSKSGITCPDNGTASLSGSSKLKVSGGDVLLQTGASSWGITGCTQTNANASEKPCTKIVAVTGGIAGKLKVGGTAVLLESFSGTSEGTPKNTLSASAKQAKLNAI